MNLIPRFLTAAFSHANLPEPSPVPFLAGLYMKGDTPTPPEDPIVFLYEAGERGPRTRAQGF